MTRSSLTRRDFAAMAAIAVPGVAALRHLMPTLQAAPAPINGVTVGAQEIRMVTATFMLTKTMAAGLQSSRGP